MSRAGRLFLVGLLAVLLAPAAARGASEVGTEYDAKVDFTKFKTYAWGQKPDSGKADADARIVAGVEARLKAAGWEQSEAESADARIAVLAIVTETETLDTYYSGWGSGWGWSGNPLGAGVATTVKTGFRAGTLVIDVFDVQTKRLAWRGTASDTITEDVEKNRRTLERILNRLFAGFPPKPKAPRPAAPAH